MIRLTLNPQSDPEIHLFSKPTILMGSEPSLADLLLQGSDIHPLHLKIVEKEGVFILHNMTNDPFVSLNGFPFGKKALCSGDLIDIAGTPLLFEILEKTIHKDEIEAKHDTAEIKHPSLAQSTALTSFHLPFEEEVNAFENNNIDKNTLDSYLQEVESEQKTPTPAPLSQEKIDNKPKAPLSLKDDYLKDLDDDNQQKNAPFYVLNKEKSHLFQAWKWILVFIFTLFALTGLIGSAIYLTLSDKTGVQQAKAAQGVADIAMALTHAQLHMLKPQNHNWSDPDFLKSNLIAILPDTHSYASQIDAQGQFHCCPYSLRIYMSSDLSHFLLIAQPAPSLLNWLVPQSLIVVDSKLMELRMLKDVRGLNRLLANPTPLDGLNGQEITSLIKQENIVSLASLANESGNLDFSPPKNLGLLRPGADNFIYNAPRYFRLGNHIIQQSLTLFTKKGTSQEVNNLQQDVEALLSHLEHVTLYSDQGKKSALIAKQGLTLFSPSDKMLFGYLLFNAQGKIHQVHLIQDEEDSLPFTEKRKESETIALNTINPPTPLPPVTSSPNHEVVDKNHPIYIQIQSLVALRENELKPIASSLIDLIEQDLTSPRAKFQTEFQYLSHSYLMTNAKHKQAIKEALDNLYNQYEDIPLSSFLETIKALRLDQLIQQNDGSLSVIDENCQQNIDLLLTYIDNSKSLVELDNLVHIASSWLNFNCVKDPKELMRYQNLLRNALLAEIEKYLLSQKKQILIKRDDKEVLEHILSQERLIKPNEKDYFLAEFEEISFLVERNLAQ